LTSLILPTSGQEIPRPWFLPTAEALAEQRRMLEAEFFLVRIRGNHGIGEALICDPKKGGCGRKHTHITLRCVPQPFNGVSHGLYAYYRTVGDNGLERNLSASERLRFEGIKENFGGLPELAASHPQLARSLSPNANDALIGAFALGLFETIDKFEAQRLADQINIRGVKPPFALPGLKVR